MKSIEGILRSMPLFDGIERENYDAVLRCMKSRIGVYRRDESICEAKEPLHSAGIVLSGKVCVSFLSEDGNEHEVRVFGKGTLFGEAIACIPEMRQPVHIKALQKSEILFLRFTELFTEKARHCPCAAQVTQNLLREMAGKNLFLVNKVEILARRKIRDRVCLYLKNLRRDEENQIVLPHNRQEMANFLGVDRSALSRELSYMREEGLLLIHKNRITVLDPSVLSMEEKGSSVFCEP